MLFWGAGYLELSQRFGGQDIPISVFHQVLISRPYLSENCSVSFCVIFLIVIRDGGQCACSVSGGTGSSWWLLFTPKYSSFCFICYSFIKVEFTCLHSLTLGIPLNDFSKFTELWNHHHSPILAHFCDPTLLLLICSHSLLVPFKKKKNKLKTTAKCEDQHHQTHIPTILVVRS